MQDLLIQHAKVVLFENDDITIKKADVLVQEGKISKIEENIPKEIAKGAKIIEAKNHILMPGFINTHAHIPMSIFRETTEGVKLYDWLHKIIWPMEEKLTKEDVYWASMLSFIEMISTGTTCINDQYFMQDAIRKAARDVGARAVLTRTIIGEKEEALEKIAEFKNFYETRDQKDDLITYSVAPHALYTCSKETLQMTADLAKDFHLPIHVHFLESIDEIEDIKQKHGKRAVEVLKQHFDGIHTILAHAVHLDNKDIEILKTMDCGIAHNPISNLRLGCSIADTTSYLQNGINVALGTDGQGSRK